MTEELKKFKLDLAILFSTYILTDEAVEPATYRNSKWDYVEVFVRWSDWDIDVSIYPTPFNEDDSIGWWIIDMSDFDDIDIKQWLISLIAAKVEFAVELSENY